MLSVLKSLNTNIKVNGEKLYKIDNLAFKFHYRLTTNLLLVLVVIVTSQELFQEHIKCIVGRSVNEKVVNTFCYFKSTYTELKYLENNQSENIYPGIGPSSKKGKDFIIRHAYYQWVSYLLVFQALTFYIPHYIWKMKEGGTMKKLIEGLEFAAFAGEKSLPIGNSRKTPTKKEIEEKFDLLKCVFKDHLVVNRNWTHWLITCEFLNLFNLIAQILLTNTFLNNEFYLLGRNLLRNIKAEAHILDKIFPKITKCSFHKFGASGSIQNHEALCLMPLNIIHEKIFSFLWFWYSFLLIISISALIYRGFTCMFYSKSLNLNRLIFLGNYSAGKQLWTIMNITKHSCYMDWLFLVYLAKNMDGLVYQSFLKKLIEDFYPKKILKNFYRENKREKIVDKMFGDGEVHFDNVTNEIYPDITAVFTI